MKSFNYRIFFLFVIIILSWGLAWPASKIGLLYMSPLWYTTVRLLIGTIAMLIICAVTKKLSLPTRLDLPLILTIGLLQIGVYILLTSIGLTYLPAGKSALLAYTTPLWVMPIATLFFHEESGLSRWIGFIIAVAGLTILIEPWKLNWSDHHIIFGSGALLLASFAWAVSMFCIRHMRWTKSPLELIPWQLLTGMLPVMIFAWIKEPAMPVDWNFPLLLSLAYTGIIVTGISYWLGIIINKELPTIVVSVGFLCVPVLSLIVSAIFMGELINLQTVMAVTLILSGLGLVIRD
jgi:drug/metabolite transporter (DMT)-like permease